MCVYSSVNSYHYHETKYRTWLYMVHLCRYRYNRDHVALPANSAGIQIGNLTLWLVCNRIFCRNFTWIVGENPNNNKFLWKFNLRVFLKQNLTVHVKPSWYFCILLILLRFFLFLTTEYTPQNFLLKNTSKCPVIYTWKNLKKRIWIIKFYKSNHSNVKCNNILF